MTTPGKLHSMRRTILAVSLSLPLGSCLVVAGLAVIGAVKYTDNGVEREFRHDLPTCFAAAKQSMQENGYAIPDDAAPRQTWGELSADDAVITLIRQPGATESADDDFTHVVTRTGSFDTEETQRKARLLMDALARALGEPVN